MTLVARVRWAFLFKLLDRSPVGHDENHHEAGAERALGLEVAGFSCLTNFAAGISAGELSHEEVLEIGKGAAADFAKLLKAAL